MHGEVQRQVVLPAGVDEVWEALTDSEQLSEWFGAEVDLDPRPGGEGTFVGDDGEVRRARVEEVESGKRLALWWWLDHAGLVTASRDGRERHYRLTPAPFTAAAAWMAEVGAGWDDRLASLEKFLAGRRR